MHTSLTSLPLLLAATLLISPSILAHPTSSITGRAPLHPCSVFIQRWYSGSFDTAYYSAGLTPDGQVPNANFWNQESVDSGWEGGELVPWQVGSNTLHITNVANPVNNSPQDPGKLSFVWGNQQWDTFSPGNPCFVKPVGTWEGAGATTYACNFQCDK
ncbi:uncharacterized protein BP5553_07160 [Venustampulla echinocandica]|uniref:Uncharacterized protein n=1 Tax=Venustampulla echinocandica TaxID=2656787 RepID=A0A370TIN8_9HELO|nr:uncharacterized protein BP5553_07160 [Venustampulla echinocandica]RDL35229.1 hypothetical protein BP5553_07160 [Venustampulla echinocandica]